MGEVILSDEAFGKLSGKIKNLEKDLEKQDKRTQNVITGVLFAFLFIIGIIAVDVMYFHTNDKKESAQQKYLHEVKKPIIK